jgi:hypothetical protein
MTQADNTERAWLDLLLSVARGVPMPAPRAYVDPWIRDTATDGPAVPPLPTLKRFNGFHSL